MVNPFSGVYAGKRVLVTGHTGFKGGWLSLWLGHLGAEVHGLALAPDKDFNFFSLLPSSLFKSSWIQDLNDEAKLSDAMASIQPEVIFHLAAQPIVGVSYQDPLGTFKTNALGTAVLLEGVRRAKCSAAVVTVTSDKCYRNENTGRPFREEDPLGGHDVYSMSKAAAELVAASWHASFFSKDENLGPMATARAGNVIGGGDYAEDRIIPDAVRAFIHRQPLVLRRPQATRPWQHVLESVAGYLALGQRLLLQRDKSGLLNFNFGPDFEAERSVQDLMTAWLAAWPESLSLHASPDPTYGEATRLSLDHSRAVRELGWKPVWNFTTTVAETAAWYRRRHESNADEASMLQFSLGQIQSYTQDAARAGVAWTH